MGSSCVWVSGRVFRHQMPVDLLSDYEHEYIAMRKDLIETIWVTFQLHCSFRRTRYTARCVAQVLIHLIILDHMKIALGILEAGPLCPLTVDEL